MSVRWTDPGCFDLDQRAYAQLQRERTPHWKPITRIPAGAKCVVRKHGKLVRQPLKTLRMGQVAKRNQAKRDREKEWTRLALSRAGQIQSPNRVLEEQHSWVEGIYEREIVAMAEKEHI